MSVRSHRDKNLSESNLDAMTTKISPFRSRMNTMDIKTTRKWQDGYPFVYIDSSDEEEGNCGCFGKSRRKVKKGSGKKTVKVQQVITPPIFILPRIITTTAPGSCHSCQQSAIYPVHYAPSIRSSHSIKTVSSQRLQPIMHTVNWHPDVESSLGYGSKNGGGDGDSWGKDSFGSCSDSDSFSRASSRSECGDGSSSSGYDIVRPRTSQ